MFFWQTVHMHLCCNLFVIVQCPKEKKIKTNVVDFVKTFPSWHMFLRRQLKSKTSLL